MTGFTCNGAHKETVDIALVTLGMNGRFPHGKSASVPQKDRALCARFVKIPQSMRTYSGTNSWSGGLLEMLRAQMTNARQQSSGYKSGLVGTTVNATLQMSSLTMWRQRGKVFSNHKDAKRRTVLTLRIMLMCGCCGCR